MNKHINSRKRKQTKSFKKILLSIWTNLKVLQIISVISTVISLYFGIVEIKSLVDKIATENLINELCDSSLNLNLSDKSFKREWLKKVETLRDKPEFQDSYNYLKGMGLIFVTTQDPLFKTELPPLFYLNKIGVNSKYYDDIIIFRCIDITSNAADSLKVYKLTELINELETANYKTPRYYFIKYIYALNIGSVDILLSNYFDLRKKYLDTPDYNNEYINDVINSDNKKIADLTQIQTLEYLYNVEILRKIRKLKKISHLIGVDDIKNMQLWEISCKEFLYKISQLPDNQLGFLRGGLTAFHLNNSLFPPDLNIQLFNNDKEWFEAERYYLEKFLNSEN